MGPGIGQADGGSTWGWHACCLPHRMGATCVRSWRTATPRSSPCPGHDAPPSCGTSRRGDSSPSSRRARGVSPGGTRLVTMKVQLEPFALDLRPLVNAGGEARRRSGWLVQALRQRRQSRYHQRGDLGRTHRSACRRRAISAVWVPMARTSSPSTTLRGRCGGSTEGTPLPQT